MEKNLAMRPAKTPDAQLQEVVIYYYVFVALDRLCIYFLLTCEIPVHPYLCISMCDFQSNSAVETERRAFHQEAMSYVMKLQEVQERKKFEFVETVGILANFQLTNKQQIHILVLELSSPVPCPKSLLAYCMT